MQSENKTRNLQTKKNQDILSGLTAPPPQQTSQNAPSFPGAPPQPIVPNQNKEPIKAVKSMLCSAIYSHTLKGIFPSARVLTRYLRHSNALASNLQSRHS